MILAEKLKQFNLILASASPRRAELLTQMQLPFTVAEKFDCNESYHKELCSDMVAKFLSTVKSMAYDKILAKTDILLTADTVVVCKDKVLGKPKSRQEAVDMLKKLSGYTHRVVSGVTLRSVDKFDCFSDSTMVSFRELNSEEIEYYADKFAPMDKAGSYGVQEWIGLVGIEKIIGSFYNVMGLPTEKLYRKLEKFIG
ncbi:MAG: Maf family nucleotide pyrophosphatase [Rikenellaceae bacterium]